MPTNSEILAPAIRTLADTLASTPCTDVARHSGVERSLAKLCQEYLADHIEGAGYEARVVFYPIDPALR